MKRQTQLLIDGLHGMKLKEFGGLHLKGNPREARPLSFKRPLHLVMRSSRAKGTRSFLNPKRAARINKLVRTLGRELGVRVYRFANSGNHLHFILLPHSREAYVKYVKSVSGIIARLTLEKERGVGARFGGQYGEMDSPKDKNCQGNPPQICWDDRMVRSERFWDARPFTRIVEWGRDFNRVSDYLLQNSLEAIGFIPYRPRGRSKDRVESTA